MPSIIQLDTSTQYTPGDFDKYRSNGLVYACDFYISGSEEWDSVPGGYQTGWLVSVDHHGSTERMRRQISSTTLAIEHVRRFGPATQSDTVIINHTDCDSILSSRVLSGDIEALDMFNDAAIAADHTGDANEIADLLQALDTEPFRKHEISYVNLQLTLDGKRDLYDPYIRKALDARLAKRDEACALVSHNRFVRSGHLAYAILTEKIDGELFIPFIDEALLIMTASPCPVDVNRWIIRLRLGKSAPAGMSLKNINIGSFDRKYSGRWNAGSNNRAGGTSLNPYNYAERLCNTFKDFLSAGNNVMGNDLEQITPQLHGITADATSSRTGHDELNTCPAF
ncbi:MAG: hypothetical protein WCG31_05215 [Deltaproteobacteria bacterium]